MATVTGKVSTVVQKKDRNNGVPEDNISQAFLTPPRSGNAPLTS